MNEQQQNGPGRAPAWWAQVQEAARVLRDGGVVAYPSETVWGLAAHPSRPDAIRRLYDLKGRAADKPVQVSCVDVAAARALIRPSEAFERLAPLWPGPLTLVTPAAPGCPADLAPGGRVGVRLPDHPVARALLEAVGGTLATTSCNPSGEEAAATHAQALAMGLGDLTLPDGGQGTLGLPSTVVLLPEGRVLRAGAIPDAQIESLLRELT
ncbi:SUA5-like protein [Deinococcus seoulensis]|uniref:L-threonylcarbamoyladenylate synthase n=1 Tax=Deinococcus seoulensis TaxID=1837379 RepID=A0ABQ2RRE9_9DEIO|nr:L-threonylcarbamoyladenylate synthase [Deinococcus seoulensis]GGR60029.1 SUA5-like protein [Deinococcus seoulensis]